MKRYDFVVAKHEDYGELGLRPVWYPTGDPLSGMAAAHDILEHWPHDNGDTEGELMALGASCWIRGDGGYHNGYRRYDSVRDPSTDIPDVWDRTIEREGGIIQSCGLVRDSTALDMGRNIIAEGFKEIRERSERTCWPSKETRERMARWIARGYVRVQHRYRHVIGGACAMAGLFKRIQDAADSALKHAEEGMIFTVFVNVKRSDMRAFCDYPIEE